MARPRLIAMKTRLAALALVPLLLSGCGQASPEAQEPSLSQSPGGGGDIGHPTGPDDVVLAIQDSGGFVPVEFAFGSQPTLLVTGDGRLYLPADQRSWLVIQPMLVGQLTEEQVQALLAAANDAGLLAPAPDYAADEPTVTDMPVTTVEIHTVDGDFVHQAYALGVADERGVRRALADFIDRARTLVRDVATDDHRPDAVVVESGRPITQPPTYEPRWQPRDIPWPATAGHRLGQRACSVVTDPATVDLLLELEPARPPSRPTYFTQGDRRFQIMVRAQLPGDRGCARP